MSTWESPVELEPGTPLPPPFSLLVVGELLGRTATGGYLYRVGIEGKEMADSTVCNYCGGTGEVPESSTKYMPCPKCSKNRADSEFGTENMERIRCDCGATYSSEWKGTTCLDCDRPIGKPEESHVQSSRDWANLLNWIHRFGDDQRVLEWETDHPEPEGWDGMPHSYAYENMPGAKELAEEAGGGGGGARRPDGETEFKEELTETLDESYPGQNRFAVEEETGEAHE